MAGIGDTLKTDLNEAAASAASALGKTVSGSTKLADTTVQGSLKAADKLTKAGLDTVGEVGVAGIDATGRIGVASADAAATVGESGTKVVSTAAKAVASTADTMYETAAMMTRVAAAKGTAIAEDSIAVNKAKTKAIHDKDNVEKRYEAAKTEEDLRLTKLKYEAQQAKLRAEAKNETDLINTQINAVKSKVKKTGELTNVQNKALIKASEAKTEVLNAQKTVEIIEKEAKNEIECRNVLEKAATKESAKDHTVLDNTIGHNTFCTNKKICGSTGRVHPWYNILGSNRTTCKGIKEKYKTFEGMSSNAVAAAGGGRKMSRKKNTRRPKKNTRRPKKNTRKNKKNTRRTKKKTRRTKRRSI
jgi:hypothetical protein